MDNDVLCFNEYHISMYWHVINESKNILIKQAHDLLSTIHIHESLVYDKSGVYDFKSFQTFIDI